jgi:DNA replication protein DnaC
MSHDPLPILLRSLRLSAMAEMYDGAIQRAEAENWGYKKFLGHLAETEASDRLSSKVRRQLQHADLLKGKTFATLDVNRWPEKVRRQLPSLLEPDFVRRGDNVLCFGLPGRGKSSFASALAHEWITRHQFKVLFISTFKLVGQLLEAKRELKFNALLAKFQRYDAVICDQLGYIQQSSAEGEVLFHFLAERYEKKTVIITSNLVFSQWDQVFQNPMTAMAAADRLVHHGVILEFSNESIRDPNSGRGSTQAPP